MNSIDGFITRPLSETRRYKEVEQDPISAGREQKADYVLAPFYQLDAGKIRITTHVWNVATGQVEDSYVFQKETAGVFAVQDAAAVDVADRLMIRFGGRSNGISVKRGTNNEEAFRRYQLGMALFDKQGSYLPKAFEYLNEAVTMDPNYANAWAGLARVTRPGYGKQYQSRDEYQRSIDAINKALSIDPNLADAFVSLCDVKLFYEYDAKGAESACIRALELDPNSADAHVTYNMLLVSRGRFDEAFTEVKAAINLSPMSFRIQRQYANTLYGVRRYPEAEEQYKRLVDYTSGDRTIYRRLIKTLEAEGKESDALEYLVKLLAVEGKDAATIERFRRVFATSGWGGVVLERIKLSEGEEMPNFFLIADSYAHLGDKDKAFENLEKAFANRGILMMFLRVESHNFDSLRDDPRFDDLIRRVEGS